ncbi:MAG: hypothetical protein O3A77_04410 [bacterium]|nr:hypothetical protein [bacterium]
MSTLPLQTIASGSSPRRIGSSHLDLVRAGQDQTKTVTLKNKFTPQTHLTTSAHLSPTATPMMMLSEEAYIRIISRMNRYHVHRYTGNIVYSIYPHKIRRFNPKTLSSDDETEDETELGIRETGYWHINGDYVGPSL